MSNDRNRRIEVLFGRALELPVSKRDEFLKSECGSDESLFARIQELLDEATDPPLNDMPNPQPLAELLAANDQRNSDANVLCGILGLQMDFFQAAQLVAAFKVWLADKFKPVALILVDQGILTSDTHALLTVVAEKHLQLHGGDVEISLAAVNCTKSVHGELNLLCDADLTHSVSLLSVFTSNKDLSTTAARNTSSASLRFRVLRPHAQGGLGEVFVAQDVELNREVALKEIQQQFANHQEPRSRFLREAEITGGLEHPGIVPVYGLGQYPDGRPFYAMRFIRGDNLREAINRFFKSDELDRDPGERSIDFRKLLGRFMDVCDAMEYAHSRGILHRDLKPGNIMLGKYGETLVVDWGLAKSITKTDLGRAIDDESILQPSTAADPTRIGSAMGTPSYMSPEQANGELAPLRASDVYGLGATLYHLLTGKMAFEGRDPDELLGKVKRGEFIPPRARNIRVPAALSAICVKAMALEPKDRYESPRKLSDDIEHWLADEPVSCLVEPFTVRARRWLRRHRTLVVSSTVASVILVIGLVVLMILVASHNRELSAKNQQLDTSNSQLAKANSNLSIANESERAAKEFANQKRVDAENARDDTRRVLDYLVGAFRMPDPMYDGEKITVAEMLGQAVDQLEKEFVDQPLFRAQILTAIGKTYLGLSLYEKAIKVHKQVLAIRRSELGDSDKATIASMDNLANSYIDAGEVGDALPLYLEAQGLMKAHYSADDHDALSVSTHLAHAYIEANKLPEAIELLEKNLEIQMSKFGLEDLSTLSTMNMLAKGYVLTKRPLEALPLLEQTIERMKTKLGPTHVDTLAVVNTLCGAYLWTGKADKAVPLCEEILKVRKAKLGPKHAATLEATNNLAVAYNDSGRVADAIPLYEESLEMLKERIGLKHPNTIQSMLNLAAAYRSSNRASEALPHYEQALGLLEEKLGPDDPKTLVTMNNFARAYELSNRIDDALPLYEKALELSIAKVGHKDPNTTKFMLSLANAHLAHAQRDKAILLFENFIQVHREKSMPDDPNFAGLLAEISFVLLQNHEFEMAATDLRECLEIRGKAIPDDWTTFNTKSMLGGCLLGQKNFAEAEPLLLSGYEGLKERQDKIPAKSKDKLIEAAQRIVELYTSMDSPEKAAEWQTTIDEAKQQKKIEQNPTKGSK